GAHVLHRGHAASTFPAAMRSSFTIPPVLCYHRIGGPPELGVTRVAHSVFARQMQALARSGWRTVPLREFVIRVQGRVPSSPNEFLLSFDDGYASLADNAYPVLVDVGFTATTFLVTDFVGRTNTWDVRYTWRRLPHLDWDAIEVRQPAPGVAHVPGVRAAHEHLGRALHLAPAAAPRLGCDQELARTGTRVRLAHRFARPAHLALGRASRRRAGTFTPDARRPAGTGRGPGGGVPVRRARRANRGPGARRGVRGRIRRGAGERIGARPGPRPGLHVG